MPKKFFVCEKIYNFTHEIELVCVCVRAQYIVYNIYN